MSDSTAIQAESTASKWDEARNAVFAEQQHGSGSLRTMQAYSGMRAAVTDPPYLIEPG